MIFPLFLLTVGVYAFFAITYDMLFVKFKPKPLLKFYLFILPYIALTGYFVWFVYDMTGDFTLIKY